MVQNSDTHNVLTAVEAAYVTHRNRKTIEARCKSGALDCRHAGKGKRKTWLVSLQSLVNNYELDLDRLEELYSAD